MARNGSGVYSLPTGSVVSPGDGIEASQHNAPLQDLEAEANTPRPISAGGTGANNAAGALTNLGVTATAAELNRSSGITSNIQTQLDGKSPSSSPTFAGTLSNNRIRMLVPGDVSLTSTLHPLQMGADDGVNMAMDNNEIQVRDNGETAPLRLNTEGGDVVVSKAGDLTTVGGNLRVAQTFTADGDVDFDQTTVDVTSVRSEGVTYQNTTGKPIVVYIQGTNTSASFSGVASVSANGSAFVPVSRIPKDNEYICTFTVPRGHYYKLEAVSQVSIIVWSELR